MDIYEQIDKALQREIALYYEDLENGEITQEDYDIAVNRLEREARQELREAEQAQSRY